MSGEVRPAASREESDARGLTVAEAQARVDTWISRFEEGYWPPLTNLARLIEEVGELAREMNHRFGHKTKKPDEPEQDLAIELADILFVLMVIANEQGIDLGNALERVLEKYRTRDSDRWSPVRGKAGGSSGSADGRGGDLEAR
jgi:NTP pyrophosphatase (non-canonical NTP hydrolase)